MTENTNPRSSVGIYRVHYPQSMLDALVPGIQDQTLSPQDRYNIQTDVYALTRAGQIDLVDFFQLLRHAYKHEENFTVWKSILKQLGELNSIFNYAALETTKKLYQAFICDLLSHIYNKLEWDPLPNEGLQAAMLRGHILIQMGVNQYHRACDEARKRFEKIMNDATDHQPVNPNIRAAIYLIVAKTGNQRTFEQLKSVRRVLRSSRRSLILSSSSIEKQIYKKSIFACWLLSVVSMIQAFSSKHWSFFGTRSFAVHHFFSISIDFLQDEVRVQDHLIAFTSLAGHNRQGSEICWKYLQENWPAIEEMYGEHDPHLIHFVEVR